MTDCINFEQAILQSEDIVVKQNKEGLYDARYQVKHGRRFFQMNDFNSEQEAKDTIKKVMIKNFINEIQKHNLNPYIGRCFMDNYIAYPNGKIFNITGREVKGVINSTGYRVFTKGEKIHLWHRIIAKLFIPNPNNLPQINHLNAIKIDNRIENLEWCDSSRNTKHAYDMGLEQKRLGEKHPMHKLTIENAKYIKQHYIKLDKNFGAVALARKFNVKPPTITDVVYGRTWKEV